MLFLKVKAKILMGEDADQHHVKVHHWSCIFLIIVFDSIIYFMLLNDFATEVDSDGDDHDVSENQDPES